MIIFEEVSMKNFMSVGNHPLTIFLNKAQSTFVTAKNGTGKSSVMLDSLCFALYNKPYRDINKPMLINSINLKQCEVSVKFRIGKKSFLVKRGMKPSIFEIWEDGILVNQDPSAKDYQKVLEQQILKMNYRAFTQVVVMGSTAYIPFMKLKPDQRREFIEDLLDIKIFTMMGKLNNADVKVSKDKLKETENEIVSAKEIIKVIESHVLSKKEADATRQEEINAAILSCKGDIERCNEDYASVSDQIKAKRDDAADAKKSGDTYAELIRARGSIVKKIAAAEAQKEEYSRVSTCHTCNQQIGQDIKDAYNATADENISKYKENIAIADTRIAKLAPEYARYEALQGEISELNARLGEINQQIYGSNLLIQKYNKELASIAAASSVADDSTIKLRDTAKKIVDLTLQKKNLTETIQLHAVASSLLQDSGVKAKVIKQYIPLLNKMVNKYLGLLDFFCSFHLDESFSEVVKSRHRDNFTYDSFSQGEKQRIDFSLMLTWRDIAKKKNSVNTNLLIIDELFGASLDEDGVTALLGLFKKIEDTNIFVVSHQLELASKFPATLALVKKNNFTQLAA